MRQRRLVLTCVAVSSLTACFAQATLSRADQEEFLLLARVQHETPVGKGVSASWRVTLSDGRTTHDAHLQTIDAQSSEFRTEKYVELNFRDTYKFNIAAYRLDKLLELGMVPTSVERAHGGRHGALTWWVDNVIGDEKGREKGKFTPPDATAYNTQVHATRVFTNLVFNTDPNTGNFLTDSAYDIWMIDFTRAFRRHKQLMNAAGLVRCDRKLLANLRALDADAVRRELGKYLVKAEIEGLLARRDLIVKHFDALVAAKGEAAVLYDMKRTAALR